MTLHGVEESGLVPLQQGEVFAFAGEQAWVAELPDGPINDFNLMVRRGQGRGDLAVRTGTHQFDLGEGSTVLHCVSGAYDVIGHDDSIWRLGPGDSLRVAVSAGCSAPVEVVGQSPESVLVDARIRPAPAL